MRERGGKRHCFFETTLNPAFNKVLW